MTEPEILSHICLFPSLCTITATRIITRLCEFYIATDEETTQVNSISEIIEQLKMPPKIIRYLLSLIRPVVAELAVFKKTINSNLPPEHRDWNFSSDDEFSVSWSGLGIIDVVATSNSFFKCRKLPINLEFERACLNCAEEEIYRMWPLVKNDVIPIVDGVKNIWTCCKSNVNHSVLFWGNYIKKGSQRSPTQDLCFWKALSKACLEGNMSSLKFLFEYVDYDHQPYTFLNTLHHPDRDNIKMVHYLMVLLQSGKERVIKELFESPASLLLCFLEWPLREYFTELTSIVRSQLTCADFCYVTKEIVLKKGLNNLETPIYTELFDRWWNGARAQYKETFQKTKPAALKRRPYTSFVFQVGIPRIQPEE